MAKKEEQVKVPEIIDNVDALVAKRSSERICNLHTGTGGQDLL